MVSVLLEIFGWCAIAVGTLVTSTKLRTLQRLIRLGASETIEPELRVEWIYAWSGLLALAWGVYGVSYWWLHDTLIWLPSGCSVMIPILIVVSWSWLRNKVRSV